MNIFYVDRNPRKAAQWLVNSHVVKMILESAQLLSTAHRVLDPHVNKDEYYKATHIHHPSAVWVRQSIHHYKWLFEHFQALCEEYSYRYQKAHYCATMLGILKIPPYNIPLDVPFTDPPCAMDDVFKISDDAVLNYRNYYKFGKSHLHRWRKRMPPKWVYPSLQQQVRR